MLVLDRQRADDVGAVEDLLDACFGPKRHAKTAQRLRDCRLPAEGLAFVVRDHAGPWGDRLVGTLTFWNVLAGPATPALLLGPLAVHPDYQGARLGTTLVQRGLAEARERGHGAVILVGDEPYYRRFGFAREPVASLAMPGWTDERRFLGVELRKGALAHAAGVLRPAGVMTPVEPLPMAA